jgi:hypothetical protein
MQPLNDRPTGGRPRDGLSTVGRDERNYFRFLAGMRLASPAAIVLTQLRRAGTRLAPQAGTRDA